MKTLIKFEVVKRYYSETKGRENGYVLTLFGESHEGFSVDNMHNQISFTLVLPKTEGERYPIGTTMELVVE